MSEEMSPLGAVKKARERIAANLNEWLSERDQMQNRLKTVSEIVSKHEAQLAAFDKFLAENGGGS